MSNSQNKTVFSFCGIVTNIFFEFVFKILYFRNEFSKKTLRIVTHFSKQKYIFLSFKCVNPKLQLIRPSNFNIMLKKLPTLRSEKERLKIKFKLQVQILNMYNSNV